MTSYVLGFAFWRDEVVLIEKTKPAWQAGKLNGLGGKIELGEYPKRAMVREFHEECGMLTREDDWTEYVTMYSGPHIIYVFKTELPIMVSMFKHSDEGRVATYHWPTIGYSSQSLPNLSWLIPLAKMEAGVEADVFYPNDPLEKK